MDIAPWGLNRQKEMTEHEIKNRWAKSLEEAGLLDEIEDSWKLESDGATITVKGKPPILENQSKEKDSTVPFAIPVPSMPSQQVMPEDPDLTPTQDPTQDSEHLGSPKRTVRNLGAPATAQKNREPADSSSDEAKSKPISENSFLEDPVVTVNGKQISVAPESHTSRHTLPKGPIFDEPPNLDDIFSRMKKDSNVGPCEYKGESLRIPDEACDEPDDLVEMRECLETGDYSGALKFAEKIVKNDPVNKEANKCRDDSKAILLQMYESKIGAMDRRPNVSISTDEIIWRNLDPQAGFVLSQIDGTTTYDEILDISGMSKFDTCRILSNLLQEGLIK